MTAPGPPSPERVVEAKRWFRENPYRVDVLERGAAIERDCRHAAVLVRAALADGPDERTDHRCDLPQRDPEDRTSWSARRWDCPECGIRWIYVQRMIRRKIHGEWRRMPGQSSELDQARSELDRLRVRVAELEGAARLRCTCDYAGQPGEPHKPFCEQEYGPHAECATRHDVDQARIAELRGAGNALADAAATLLGRPETWTARDWAAADEQVDAWRSAAGGET